MTSACEHSNLRLSEHYNNALLLETGDVLVLLLVPSVVLKRTDRSYIIVVYIIVGLGICVGACSHVAINCSLDLLQTRRPRRRSARRGYPHDTTTATAVAKTYS